MILCVSFFNRTKENQNRIWKDRFEMNQNITQDRICEKSQ